VVADRRLLDPWGPERAARGLTGWTNDPAAHEALLAVLRRFLEEEHGRD
jgi:hypothetical protein